MNDNHGYSFMRVENILGLGIALGLIIGIITICLRLEPQTLAVIVGSVCGIAGVIPSVALVIFLLLRQHRDQVQVPPGYQQSQSPPVIVIQGGGALPPGQSQPGYWPAPRVPDHELIASRGSGYRVIGDE